MPHSFRSSSGSPDVESVTMTVSLMVGDDRRATPRCLVATAVSFPADRVHAAWHPNPVEKSSAPGEIRMHLLSVSRDGANRAVSSLSPTRPCRLPVLYRRGAGLARTRPGAPGLHSSMGEGRRTMLKRVLASVALGGLVLLTASTPAMARGGGGHMGGGHMSSPVMMHRGGGSMAHAGSGHFRSPDRK